MECSEIENEIIKDLKDENGNIIGIEYDGGFEEFEYGVHILPQIRIKINKDGKEVLLNTANLKLNVYNYQNYEEEYLYYITPTYEYEDGNGITKNYFLFDPSGLETPVIRKFKIIEIEDDGTEKEYELNKSVIKLSNYGVTPYIEITLETTDPNAGNDGSILEGIQNIVIMLGNFISNFGQVVKDTIIDAIVSIIELIFVPPENLMNVMQEDLYNKVIANIPILELPYELLENIINGNSAYWIGESCGLSWNEIQLNNTSIFPGGSINLIDFVNSHEAFKEIHKIWYIIIDGILGIKFIEYLKRKFDIVFG